MKDSRMTGRAIAAVMLTTVASGCGPGVAPFVRLDAPVVALTHVRVIDGTGHAARDSQTVILEEGRVGDVGPASSLQIPSGAQVLELPGRTVFPGLIGMHEHLFYQIEPPGAGTIAIAPQSTFAKLYLASGVTTIRTAGAIDLAGDIRIKQRIDEGIEPGPRVYVSSPYLNATGAEPDGRAIARQVFDAADQGATSFKAYTSLRFDELQAAVFAAHSRGLHVTGHLCAVGFREAANIGIDNLEHGLFVDTEFFPGKRRDQCPDQGQVVTQLIKMDVNGPEIRRTVADLVQHHVALTSTLAVLETLTGQASAFDPRTTRIFSSSMQSLYEEARAPWSDPNAPATRAWMQMLAMEMRFERAFVLAGGRLMAGVDPTGWGGIVAGYGDQRELELLVSAGFTPEAAIQIATSNAAAFLRERDRGTIAPGMRADLVVVEGNPSERISDVRHVEMVFKDGVAYDPGALIDATTGSVSRYDFSRLLRWPWNALIGTLLAWMVARRLWRRFRNAGEIT